MKSFKFTVQKILDLKKKIEENEKIQLVRLKTELNILYEELAVIENTYKDTVSELKESTMVGTTPVKLAEMTLYLKEIDKKRVSKESEISKTLAKMQRQTEVLKEILKEVRMLEKLKEKQLDAYNKKLSKEEELSIEDFLAGKPKD
jgi:flagellar export protein FliJ